MTHQVQAAAAVIENLSSSLKNRILMSGAFKIGGKAISLVEKINRMEVAEQKFGRRVVDASTGNPQVDTLRSQLEEVLAAYGSIMDEGGIELETIASLEALVASRETPYMKVLTNEQLQLRSQLSGQSVTTIQKQQYDIAVTKASAFAEKSGAILGELESALAFAPNWELADIPAEMWPMGDSIENAVKKYKAGVAAGKVWDETDMILAMDDIREIEKSL